MKVAKKSPKRLRTRRPPTRNTLTLPATAYQALDELRGALPRSTYLEGLLERERKRIEREQWIALANAHCTPEFATESLRVNAEYPIHGDA